MACGNDSVAYFATCTNTGACGDSVPAVLLRLFGNQRNELLAQASIVRSALETKDLGKLGLLQ
jgi:hypothetical protein